MTTAFDVPSSLQKVCDKDSSRYDLGNPRLFTTGTGESSLVVTNGKSLAVVPTTVGGDVIEITKDEDRHERLGSDAMAITIPIQSLPTRKGGRRGVLRDNETGDCTNLQTGATHRKPDTSRFPKVNDICPEWNGDGVTFTINAELLYNLALAICRVNSEYDKVVTIHIDKPGDDQAPLSVVGNAGIGVLMPHVEPEGKKKQYEDTVADLNKFYS